MLPSERGDMGQRSGDSSFPSRFWLATTSPSFMVFQKMMIVANRFMPAIR